MATVKYLCHGTKAFPPISFQQRTILLGLGCDVRVESFNFDFQQGGYNIVYVSKAKIVFRRVSFT